MPPFQTTGLPMRSKFNFKLVAMVGISFVLVGVSVHLLHSYQLEQSAYRLLERGDKAAQARDLDKALANYSQYLKFVPDDADALQKYVLTLDLQASSAAERVELVLKTQQVLRAKPHENALRLRLVHNLIALGRIDEATTNLRKLKGSWH